MPVTMWPFNPEPSSSPIPAATMGVLRLRCNADRENLSLQTDFPDTAELLTNYPGRLHDENNTSALPDKREPIWATAGSRFGRRIPVLGEFHDVPPPPPGPLFLRQARRLFEFTACSQTPDAVRSDRLACLSRRNHGEALRDWCA